jgi:hypothetical protein
MAVLNPSEAKSGAEGAGAALVNKGMPPGAMSSKCAEMAAIAGIKFPGE